LGSRGIAYPDEDFHDRDAEGALWRRVPSRQGQGRPEFARVHTLRQRRVMRNLRCQICAGPADRTEQGVLWLLHDDREDSPDWPENVTAAHPPLCLPCAVRSVQSCPHLRDQYVPVRVRNPEMHGVYGVLYRAGRVTPEPSDDVIVPYGDPRMRWTLASQLVRPLRDARS
jgi:hypothetical protein